MHFHILSDYLFIIPPLRVVWVSDSILNKTEINKNKYIYIAFKVVKRLVFRGHILNYTSRLSFSRFRQKTYYTRRASYPHHIKGYLTNYFTFLSYHICWYQYIEITEDKGRSNYRISSRPSHAELFVSRKGIKLCTFRRSKVQVHPSPLLGYVTSGFLDYDDKGGKKEQVSWSVHRSPNHCNVTRPYASSRLSSLTQPPRISLKINKHLFE